MATTTVKYGWVIQDRAAVLPGMGFGPRLLQGKQRSGPLVGGYHNLLVKDVVFNGKGRGALYAIIEQMKLMSNVRIRAGIQEGMSIEKFVESEFGGGDDQITVTAGKSDKTRVPYYMYVFPHKVSAYSFQGQLMSMVTRMAAFGGGLGASALPSASSLPFTVGDVVGAGQTMVDQGQTHFGGKGSELKQASNGEDVIMLLTTLQRQGSRPISTHKGSHSLASLSRDIHQALMITR